MVRRAYRRKRSRNRGRWSRLGHFMLDNELETKEVAELAGISRQHLLRLRQGTAEPTRPMMIWLATTCGLLLARRVRVSQLFDLGDSEK